MPTITNPGVIKALVAAYLVLDRDKAAAAIKIGYSKNYAINGDCSKLFDRADVLAEIDKQEVELIAKTGYTQEQCQYEYDQARRHAITLKQPSAEVSAITGKARLHGHDKDNAMHNADNPSQLSQDDIDALRTMSRELTDNGLRAASGPLKKAIGE